MTGLSRRRFIEAGAVLAATTPLSQAEARRVKRSDGVAQAAAVAQHRTTPAALVEAAIVRLDKVNPLLNAVAHPNYEAARAAARGATGMLAGVPTLTKDNVEAAGLTWTSGCRALRGRVGTTDAPIVAAMAHAGLISIGRSALPEFGLLPTTESLLTGPTRNPWRLDRSSGGSSGGSAAAVAAGVVALAHGNDGGGSIRIPASCCGLVGLKASRGRMAGDNLLRKITDFGVQGCVSRTVRDSAAFLAACEAHADAAYPPVGLVTGPSKARLRIGLARASAIGVEPHADVAAVFEVSRQLLAKARHHLVDAPPAFDGAAVVAAFDTLWSVGAAGRLKVAAAVLGRAPGPQDVEPLTLSWAAHGSRFTADDVAAATRALQQLERDYTAQFDRYDVLMTPVLGLPTLAIGQLSPLKSYDTLAPLLQKYVAYTPVENAAGAPAIALPMGSARDGTPIGMQFTTRPGGERMLLELAYELEHRVGWHRRHPPLWAG